MYTRRFKVRAANIDSVSTLKWKLAESNSCWPYYVNMAWVQVSTTHTHTHIHTHNVLPILVEIHQLETRSDTTSPGTALSACVRVNVWDCVSVCVRAQIVNKSNNQAALFRMDEYLYTWSDERTYTPLPCNTYCQVRLAHTNTHARTHTHTTLVLLYSAFTLIARRIPDS